MKICLEVLNFGPGGSLSLTRPLKVTFYGNQRKPTCARREHGNTTQKDCRSGGEPHEIKHFLMIITKK